MCTSTSCASNQPLRYIFFCTAGAAGMGITTTLASPPPYLHTFHMPHRLEASPIRCNSTLTHLRRLEGTCGAILWPALLAVHSFPFSLANLRCIRPASLYLGFPSLQLLWTFAPLHRRCIVHQVYCTYWQFLFFDAQHTLDTPPHRVSYSARQTTVCIKSFFTSLMCTVSSMHRRNDGCAPLHRRCIRCNPNGVEEHYALKCIAKYIKDGDAQRNETYRRCIFLFLFLIKKTFINLQMFRKIL